MNPIAAALALPVVVSAASFQDPAAAPSRAQTSAPSSTPTLIFRGGRLFDSETAAARPLGQLWISGERILGEKPADSAPPEGVRVVDVADCTLLPGLFDLHVHVAVPGGAMVGSSLLDPAENLATQLAFGVMHVVDLHNDPASVFALRDRSREGSELARLLAAGAAFTAPGGHGTQFMIEANSVTAIDQVGARFEKLLPFKPDVVKAIVEHGGWGSVPPMPALDEPLLAEVARRTHAANVPLFVHIWRLDEAKAAVRAGADVLAHGVYQGAVDDELLGLMKKRGTAYVPTLAVVFGARRVSAGKSPYTAERIAGLLDGELATALADPASINWASQWREADEKLYLANLKRIFDAGIRVGAGTDGGNPLTPHGPSLLVEIMLYVEAGLTPGQALRCATLESARIVRHDRDFGTLAAVKVADLVVVRGDPTAKVEALWNIERVFKAGVEVDRDALRRRFAERAKAAKSAGTSLKVGEGAPAVLDDFDDDDLTSAWGGEWGGYSDQYAPGGKSRASVEIGESEGSGVLMVKGMLAEGFQYGPFSGTTIQWDPLGRRLVDASSMKSVVLRVRGSPRTLALALDRAAVKDFDLFIATFEASDDWQEVTLPLASFKQAGFGRAQPAAWHDLKGLTLQARAAPGSKEFGEFEIEVDWIRME